MSRFARTTTLLYAALIFLTSALVMVIEIVAARLIAPFVGVSLYSWTAIIGIILAGLSLGNWLGGVVADHYQSKPKHGGTFAGFILLAAGLSAFLLLLALPPLAAWVQSGGFSLTQSSLLLAGGLFFLPAALLGVITPLLTTLALVQSQRPGHIIGTMHALAALGAIGGTFAAGFWLVQWLGSRDLIFSIGLLLCLLALVFLRSQKVLLLALILTAIAALATARWGYPDPCDDESNYFCLRVVDSSLDAPWGEARSLVLDHLLHGSNHREDPSLILAPYLHLMDELAARHTAGNPVPSYFFAGGGAYTLPRAAFFRDPQANIVVAEIDPAVTNIAAEKLFIAPDNYRIIHRDARVALSAHADHHFDLIIGDVFHDIAIPHHLLTREFAALAARKLRPQGAYLMNVVDSYPDARLAKAIAKTLRTAFGEVDIWLEQLPDRPSRHTYVISARSNAAAAATVLKNKLFADNGLPRRWLRVTHQLEKSGTPLAETPILSDDYAPVERLMADLFLGHHGL